MSSCWNVRNRTGKEARAAFARTRSGFAVRVALPSDEHVARMQRVEAPSGASLRLAVSLMCCFFILFAALGPRFAIIAVWLFGNRVDLAFDSWLWPFLGLLFAPWTTVMYLLAWSPIGGVSGAEWILVGLGVALDVATYGARSARSRYATV